MKTSGTVQYVNDKVWQDPKTKENIILWSIKFQGDSSYYNFGSNKPSVSVGDVIDLEYVESNGRNKAKPSGISHKGKTNGSGGTNTTKNSYQAKDDYWKRKEEHDLQMEPEYRLRQAQNQAIAFLAILQQGDALFKTQSEGKTGKQRFELIESFREFYTRKFYDDFYNMSHMKTQDEALEEFPNVAAETKDGEG